MIIGIIIGLQMSHITITCKIAVINPNLTSRLLEIIFVIGLYFPLSLRMKTKAGQEVLYHFADVSKMITMVLRNSSHNNWTTPAHHLLCKRTSPDVQAHNSCCAVVGTNSSGNYFYIFQQLPLYVSKTSVIPSRYFSYILRWLSLYTSTSSPIPSCIRKRFCVSLVFPTSISLIYDF